MDREVRYVCAAKVKRLRARGEGAADEHGGVDVRVEHLRRLAAGEEAELTRVVHLRRAARH